MSQIIDRRLNPKHRGQVNRQRFLRRYRSQIKAAVRGSIKQRSLTDTDKGGTITIDPTYTDEHQFGIGDGGIKQRVLPGNDRFTAGDRIERPTGNGEGSGGGAGDASDQGEGDDLFQFQLSRDEFMEFMFEDLKLPNLIKRSLDGIEGSNPVRAGYTNQGIPGRLNIVRSLKSAMMRRIAITAGYKRELSELKTKLESQAFCSELDQKKIDVLEKKIRSVPFIDDFDLKYNLVVDQPTPSSKAVMFCLMDVSGSMTESTKEIAKRFYMLLYMFLERNYERIELVFIRHHTTAKEVNEHDFFYSRETGGTIVSSALKLMNTVIAERFPAEEWNIYAAQASDGDNWNEDSHVCGNILRQQILPICQHFAYIEITSRDHQALWHEYQEIENEYPESFAMEHIINQNDIYPVFRKIFSNERETTS